MSLDEFFSDMDELVDRTVQQKEKKTLEENKLTKDEWNAVLREWNAYVLKERLKPFRDRMPYIDKYGACVMGLMPDREPITKTSTFVYVPSTLLSDREKEMIFSVCVTDNNVEAQFAKWFFHGAIAKKEGKRFVYTNGIVKKVRALVRGELEIKYKDAGTDGWGDPDWAYAKSKGVKSINELNPITYERLFYLRMWEFRAFPQQYQPKS